MLEQPQDVEVRHADAGLDHPAGARAPHHADHLLELTDNAIKEFITGSPNTWHRRGWGRRGDGNGSH